MKKHILLGVLVAFTLGFIGCMQSTKKAGKAVLQGEISGLEDAIQVRIFYMHNGDPHMDTVQVGADGTFTYETELNEPAMANLSQLMPQKSDEDTEPVIPRGVQFVLTPGSSLSMQADVLDQASFIVEGNEQNSVYNQYSTQKSEVQDEYYEILSKLREEEESLSDAETETLAQKRNSLREELNTLREEFVKTNPNYYASLYEIAISSHRYEDKVDELDQLFGLLSPELKEHSMGQSIRSQIDGLKATEPGTPAPEFLRQDMNGETVNLEDYRGQYVILSFWGSWCGPCRASHPGLKKIYEKYNKSGLEIIGISEEHEDNLEDAKAKWLEAIEEDDIGMWPQILNNQNREKMDLVKTYGIAGFPTKFLLDKEGKVVDRYLGGSDELKEELEKIFN